MRRSLLIALLALSAVAGRAEGQASLLSASAQAELSGASRSSTQSVARRSLHVVAGALVGAGLGYFTSHVVYNDWDKTANSSFSEKRRSFSISGAAVGAIAGLFVGGGSSSGAGATSLRPLRSHSDGVETISRAEIERSSATNAYEAVQLLRPNWLVTRGVKQFTETGRLTGGERNLQSTEGVPQIRAYLDFATVGEADDLRRVPLLDVQEIQFLPPAQAALQFGGGHAHGAIVVSTAIEAPQ